jgi:mannose-6-phosphate isomerase-like protein (cupin superfamily)
VNETGIRPWGIYEVLASETSFQVKTITVSAGQRLSYQRHRYRSEHWYVVLGDGLVTLEGTTLDVTAGSTVDVAAGMAHRIQNVGTVPLVFVEVQRGTYFGEDDIERLSDDYGRADSR